MKLHTQLLLLGTATAGIPVICNTLDPLSVELEELSKTYVNRAVWVLGSVQNWIFFPFAIALAAAKAAVALGWNLEMIRTALIFVSFGNKRVLFDNINII